MTRANGYGSMLAVVCISALALVRAQSVPANLTITSATQGPFQAGTSITTSGTVTVSGSTVVRYEAGSQIILQPGFHAIGGAASPSFDAIISSAPVFPNSGSGISQTFSITATDAGGFANITHVQTIVNWQASGVDGCLLDYDAANDALHMGDRTGSITSFGSMSLASPSGVLGDLVNSNCQIQAAGTRVVKSGKNTVFRAPSGSDPAQGGDPIWFKSRTQQTTNQSTKLSNGAGRISTPRLHRHWLATTILVRGYED